MPLRVGIVALAILLATALSGCSGGSPDGTPDPVTEDPRSARPGDLQADGDGDEVLLLEAPIDLVGTEDVSFEVDVPAGLVAAVATYDPELNWMMLGFRIELTGCGAYEAPLGSFPHGGNVARDFDLCDRPEPGPQTLSWTVEYGQADGRIELWGLRPVGNATTV